MSLLGHNKIKHLKWLNLRLSKSKINILLVKFSMHSLMIYLYGSSINNIDSVNVLNFRTLTSCQKGQDKQCRPRSDCLWRSSLIKVFPVLYYDKHFVNSSPDINKHFIWDQKEKSFWNFRTFTVMLDDPLKVSNLQPTPKGHNDT